VCRDSVANVSARHTAGGALSTVPVSQPISTNATATGPAT
jgi:hypothetical protein